MSMVVRVWSGIALLLVFALVPLAEAQANDQLQEAVQLFKQQEFAAAQEALLKVDREALTDEQRTQLDDLLKLVPEAIKANEKATQDLAAADEAYEAGQWDEADRLYQAIVANEYAFAAVREQAAAQRERIEEKRKLAEAAQPTGEVEGAVVTEIDEDDVEVIDESEEPPAEPVQEAVATDPAQEQAEATDQMPAPEGPRRLTPTDELRMRDALLWQRAVAKAEALMARAREAMGKDEYNEARRWADTALQSVEAAARYAEPVSKYQAAKQTVVQLKQEIADAADAFAQQRAAQQQREIRDRIKERTRLYEEQKAEKIQQLFNSAEQLRAERRFAEAAEILREILRLDPANAQARYQLDWAEDLESYAEQSNWQHDVYTQQRQALINAEKALIPWDVDVMYPKNWLELTEQRRGLGVGAGTAVEDLELNRQLDETLPPVRFDETPFDQAMEFLGQLTEINISVDWTDIVDNGIERDAPVTVKLSNLTFRTVLDEVLTQVGGDVQLAFAIGDGLLRVATKEKLDRDKAILIYDIRDLLVTVPRATRRSGFDVTQGLGEGGQGGGGAGGMFGEGNRNQDQQDDYGRGGQGGQGGGAAQGLVEQILDIIRQTVAPDSWRETGGGDASIRALRGQLIVYNTSDAHRQVADLLSQLRETRALQISVETRFLDVTANFLEQFGVDLDFVFNSGTAGYDRAVNTEGQALTDPFSGAPVLIPRPFTQSGSFAQVPPYGTPLGTGTVPQQPYNQAAFVPSQGGILPTSHYMTPVTAQQGSLSLVDPGGINTNVPGSFAQRSGFNPALNIAGSFLDNLQVDFLVRATQANARSSIVQAPRIMLFNGQASSISVGRSRQYVSSLEPQLAEGAVGFQPVQASADSGVNMWVEGTISADRRYVTLTLRVQQRGEPNFERFEVQRASGNSPGAFIMLPDSTFAILETTVSVPDGGTVLLGGLKQVGEVEVDAGVPILSKIPILKRAFTNQTTVKDTRTLLILVKSKIVIQKEAEEEAFPTFTRGGV